MTTPDFSTRLSTAMWRLDLFYHQWNDCASADQVMAKYGMRVGPNETLDNYVRGRWLAAKTRAIVHHDQLMLLDGAGSMQRHINIDRRKRNE